MRKRLNERALGVRNCLDFVSTNKMELAERRRDEF